MIVMSSIIRTKNEMNPFDSIVNKWYDALIPAHFIELDEFEAKAILAKLAQQAHDLLLSELFLPSRARSIGASLVLLCQNKPMALVRTQRVLTRWVVETLPPNEAIALQPRLAHLLSELAVGFLDTQAKEVRTVTRSLLSKMAHDLNSPLNLIIGYSGLMLRGLSGSLSDLQQNDITTIHNGGKKLQERLDNFLNLEKVEFGISKIKEERFMVAELLEEVTTSIQPLVERNENTLTISYTNEVGSITADQQQVQQVLLALLDNAAKFTVQGTIRLIVAHESSHQGDWIRFEIADSGMGIPPTRLQALLSEKVNSWESEENGWGSGLLLCRRLCQLMGGTVSATSVVGQGTTFIVRLPA